MPKISLIILHWNNFKDTFECLSSVLQIDYPNYEILVVDNGSTDDSCAALKQAYPQVNFVHNGANLGFAEGNNRGIQVALERGSDYVFLLNNDTIVQKDILQAFVKAAIAYPEAGVFGAKIYYYDEPACIWYAGGEVDPKTARCYHVGCNENDLEKKWEKLEKTSYICGCALFIRAEVVKAAGLMDPRFFLLWEEIDWCWRIRKLGFSCLFVPNAKVWHKISRSFEGGNRGPLWNYFYWRNRLLFLEKHSSFKELFFIYKRLLIKELWSLFWTFTPTYASARKGARDYFLRRFGNRKI